VDECGTHIALTPTHAWAPRSERAHGAVPHRRGANLTLIAALGASGCEAAMTLDGATDARAFEAYVREVLVPTLRPGQVIFLDNLSAHKGGVVQALVEGAGCALRFLPAYSPDFSPIELAFSKLKALLRRAGARTREALEAAIAEALALLTPADARAWFARCGYELPPDPSILSAH
jgi:transposase